jgi:hypothetical protein
MKATSSMGKSATPDDQIPLDTKNRAVHTALFLFNRG